MQTMQKVSRIVLRYLDLPIFSKAALYLFFTEKAIPECIAPSNKSKMVEEVRNMLIKNCMKIVQINRNEFTLYLCVLYVFCVFYVSNMLRSNLLAPGHKAADRVLGKRLRVFYVCFTWFLVAKRMVNSVWLHV